MNAKASRLEQFILYSAFLLANMRALVFVFLFPDTSKLLSPAWIEILLWMVAAAGVCYLLVRDGQVVQYLVMWRRNWPLVLFLLLAFISLLWSVAPLVSLFRWLELFLATLIAAFFGIRLSPMRMMEALFWFGAVLFILSIALAYGAPPTGTMYWNPFYGAWRGVYWHRNHLASITALLSAIYLMRMVYSLRDRNSKVVLDALFYVLSLVILVFARSATGFILVIVLHVFVFSAWLWLHFSNRLRRQHYLAILGLGLLAGVFILTNLDFVFGLFNRDATMTGRVSLWTHLLELAGRRPWLGHGFGAIWTLDTFREEIRVLDKWPSQPLIGDNGLLDIYLHLGIVGVLVFSAVLILITVRTFRYALTQQTLVGFFPLLVMIYAFFANITFSMFAETEVFVWSLIVIVLFMTTPNINKITDQ